MLDLLRTLQASDRMPIAQRITATEQRPDEGAPNENRTGNRRITVIIVFISANSEQSPIKLNGRQTDVHFSICHLVRPFEMTTQRLAEQKTLKFQPFGILSDKMKTKLADSLSVDHQSDRQGDSYRRMASVTLVK